MGEVVCGTLDRIWVNQYQSRILVNTKAYTRHGIVVSTTKFLMSTIRFVVCGTFDSHNVSKDRAQRFCVESSCEGIDDISSIRLNNPFYGINSFTMYLNDHIASAHGIKMEKEEISSAAEGLREESISQPVINIEACSSGGISSLLLPAPIPPLFLNSAINDPIIRIIVLDDVLARLG